MCAEIEALPDACKEKVKKGRPKPFLKEAIQNHLERPSKMSLTINAPGRQPHVRRYLAGMGPAMIDITVIDWRPVREGGSGRLLHHRHRRDA